MAYANSREDKLLLQNRLRKVLETRRVPLTRLHDLYRLWAKEKGLAFASKETLDNWLWSDFSGGNNPNWDSRKRSKPVVWSIPC